MLDAYFAAFFFFLNTVLKFISLITPVYILHADTSIASDLTLYSFLKILLQIYSFDNHHIFPYHSSFSLHLMIHIRKKGLILSLLWETNYEWWKTPSKHTRGWWRKFKFILIIGGNAVKYQYIGNMYKETIATSSYFLQWLVVFFFSFF